VTSTEGGGVRRRVYRAVMGRLWCDRCGNPYTGERCEYCVRRRIRRTAPNVEVAPFRPARPWATTDHDHDDHDRADELDSAEAGRSVTGATSRWAGRISDATNGWVDDVADRSSRWEATP
jgi:hypothetical protein